MLDKIFNEYMFIQLEHRIEAIEEKLGIKPVIVPWEIFAAEVLKHPEEIIGKNDKEQEGKR